MTTHVNAVKASQATGDIFVNLLHGPIIQVTVGTKTSTFDPPIYILPQALLCSQSGYFKDQIAAKATSGGASDEATTAAAPESSKSPPAASALVPGYTSPCFKITLHSADPGAFGSFLRYIYQGCAPFDSSPQRNPAGPQDAQIPPSILAWNLGAFLRAPDFQNYALKYTHAALGRYIRLTPHLVTWVYANTNHNDALARLVLDTLVTYWAEPNHVMKGAEGAHVEQAWIDVWGKFPGLFRAWAFGLQGKQAQQVHIAQRYMVPTPAMAPGAYVSPYTTSAPPQTLTTKAKQQHQGGYMHNLKKKEAPKPAIKQEDRPISLLKLPPGPTSKKRSASPTPAQNHPKLPKLAENPVVDLTEDKDKDNNKEKEKENK